MYCKTLEQFAVEALEHLDFAIVVIQSHLLPGYDLLVKSTDQALDDAYNWNNMAFVELKHGEYCCKRTPLVANMSSNCLSDS